MAADVVAVLAVVAAPLIQLVVVVQADTPVTVEMELTLTPEI